ncbi:unnamed protein product [Spirodela intermedia]|uniref:Uncharacterized protein n=1 Tax=Spirodela intermedia TaxID=51605 RepID=A0A7I8KJ73_SPIIN|nr:unnamed protein product [Spirodela intermedia]
MTFYTYFNFKLLETTITKASVI